MASTSNAYDFDLFDSRDHGSAAPKLPEPKAPQKQKQKNNVVKLDEKQLRRSHRHSANTVKMLMNLAVVLVIVGAIGAVVFSQVQLTELTDEINTANESLSQEKSIAIQLEMQAASKLNTEEIEQIARGRQGKGITEVHIVGGVHPDHGLEYYIDMIRRVKAILPEAAVKAFTAIELSYMIRKAGLSVEEGLRRLKEAGMEAIPGGGAEIFDQEIRSRICPDKGSTDEWLEVHETAHRLGIPTNATILYGHVEGLAHRIDHLRRLRELQDRTGGFNAFIPLKYRNFGNPMSEIGEVSVIEDLRMLAMSRIYLDNVPHIKAYWVMYGKATTELALAFGADDIDGTIDDTTKIYSMAGADDRRPSMSVEEMHRIVRAAGCRAVERDTFYNELPDR